MELYTPLIPVRGVSNCPVLAVPRCGPTACKWADMQVKIICLVLSQDPPLVLSAHSAMSHGSDMYQHISWY